MLFCLAPIVLAHREVMYERESRNGTYLSATFRARRGWLLPVKSFIELAAIASDLKHKSWGSQDVEVLEEKVKREHKEQKR